MLGLPALPRKLPSRNWLIFWAVTTTLSAGIIYDRREKRRATARWAAAVAPLAREPLPNPLALPRRITVYLEAPPADGLRVAQDHFAEYVRPVLAASGLDWEFVVGRREGDVRAVVAERARRARRAAEGPRQDGAADDSPDDSPEDQIEAVRRRNQTPKYDGVRGDVVLGRHTWKEYVRGLHEGWLGPLAPPPEVESALAEAKRANESAPQEADGPKRPPPQPRPYNAPEQYTASPLPQPIPAELAPSLPVRFPHLLGFLSTPTRMRRFFGRRYLADEIGREVASVCFCTYRDYREGADAYEQELALAHEEKDWVKSVWKDPPPPKASDDQSLGGEGETKSPMEQPREKIWASAMVLDPRIAGRMRRFELQPDEEARARRIVVPEEEIEGWIKGSLRGLWRYGVQSWKGDQHKVNLGNLDED